MRGFSEAWLKDYIARHAVGAMDPLTWREVIKLKIRRPTITLNELMRLHWRARGKLAASISAELAAQIPPQWRGRRPMERASVTITRYSVAEPDYDGAVGGTKLAIDCLLPYSRRHPHGLGLVLDDSPQHMTMRVVTVLVPHRCEQRTEILIEPLPAG